MKSGKGKKARTLPSRSGLNTLAGSPKSINDYGKATPLDVAATGPNLIQNLRNASPRQ